MTGIRNYTWEQGSDLEIAFTYKKGETKETASPVDLTDYTLRMDITPSNGNPATDRLWTFNSADNVGSSPIDQPGSEDNEATLGSNGEIYILAPRSLTLPGGPIFEKMAVGYLHFNYDIFLRTPDERQRKIMKGLLTINPSATWWL